MKAAGERVQHPSIAHRNERGRNRLVRVAFHEAGHLAMADHCGIAWRSATVNRDRPRCSYVKFFRQPKYQDRLNRACRDSRLRSWFERDAQVALGGYIAERQWVSHRISGWCASEDFWKVCEIIYALHGSHRDGEELIWKLWNKVQCEVESPRTWKRVEGYAQALLNKGTIHWRDRHRIVQAL